MRVAGQPAYFVDLTQPFFSGLSATLEHMRSGADETFAGLAGLAISYALSVTQSLNWSVRMASDLEANFVAVERIEEYVGLKSEADRHTDTDDESAKEWPTDGEVVFKESQLRYRPELPVVLKGLNITIPGGSKVGVVGRTGAGEYKAKTNMKRQPQCTLSSISPVEVAFGEKHRKVDPHGIVDENCRA